MLLRSVVMCTLVAACGRLGFDDANRGDAFAAADAAPNAPDADGDAADSNPDAPAARPPSCLGLSDTCGPAQSGDCCETLVLPTTSFFRSYDLAGDATSGDDNFPATVSTFALDRYEITVGRFRAFVESGGGVSSNPPAPGAGGRVLNATAGTWGWDPAWNVELALTRFDLNLALACDTAFATWTNAPTADDNRAINCINWYEAQAFCIWDGGFLPTDAEWNAAAAGGDEQRALPWAQPAGSLEIDPSNASYWSAATQCTGGDIFGCDREDVMPVGKKPGGDGRWGHADLAGNLWEWTVDGYQSNYEISPCNDCAGVTGTDHAIRGGGFFDEDVGLRTGIRDAQTPSFRRNSIGARCARPR